MSLVSLLISASVLFVRFSHGAHKKHTENLPYNGSLQSLQKMPVPTWFNDGKIYKWTDWQQVAE